VPEHYKGTPHRFQDPRRRPPSAFAGGVAVLYYLFIKRVVGVVGLVDMWADCASLLRSTVFNGSAC
jgi:hypothetical protein